MRQTRTILALAALMFLFGCALFSTGLESVDVSAYPARAATETAALAATPAFLPGGGSTPLPSATPAATAVPGVRAFVSYVVDGDTVDVQVDGRTYRVRYIGIDAPESGDCYSRESKAANSSLVLGQWVTLVKDVSETDRYGRLLRYVYVGPLCINEELVRRGYALASTYPPDVAQAALLAARQREAREAGAGLWSGCDAPVPEPSTATPTIAPISGASGDVDSLSAQVRIAPECSQFDPPGDDNARLNEEYVCLRNIGTTPVDLGAWHVTDAARHTYRFAPRLLPAGASVRLHTGPGVDTATDVYWGQKQAVWNNDGDTITLYARDGAQIDQYVYRR